MALVLDVHLSIFFDSTVGIVYGHCRHQVLNEATLFSDAGSQFFHIQRVDGLTQVITAFVPSIDAQVTHANLLG